MLYSQFKKVISLIDVNHHTPMSEQLQRLSDRIKQPNNEQDWSLEPNQILEIAYIVTSTYHEEDLKTQVWLKNLLNEVCDLLDEHFKKAFVILTLRDVHKILGKFFTKDTFVMAMTSHAPNSTAQLISLLYNNNIHDPMLLDAVINRAPMGLISIMNTLNKLELLNTTNIGYLRECPEHYLSMFEFVLTDLVQKGVQISPKIIHALFADQCLTSVHSTLFRNFRNSIALLNEEKLLTSERVEWLLTSKALTIDSLFEKLKKLNLLTLEKADSIRLVCLHQSPDFLLSIFKYLHRYELLTFATAKAVFDATHQFTHPWYEAFFILLPAPLANQANFNNLITFLPYIDADALELLSEIPDYQLTQERIEQLIELMRVHSQEQQLIEIWQRENPNHPVPQFSHTERQELIKKSIGQALSQYVQLFMLALEPAEEPVLLSTAQNTHTTSIHKSAAESALELAKLYQDKLDDEASCTQAIADMVAWLKSLDSTVLISRAAASALVRLFKVEVF